ncbi:GAF domain-containing protein [Thalassotalea ganghwensis]
MKAPSIPVNENLRINSLKSLNLLDTAPEEKFDRLTRTVANMFDVPIALFTLIDTDRQWFKSQVGLAVKETPRDISFCGHAILQEDTFIVNNALEDERFDDNPLVTCAPNIRFYAAQSVKAPDGSVIGTLCLIDNKPRSFSEKESLLLKQVATILELELANKNSEMLCKESKLLNEQGFNQIATIAVEACRYTQLPLCISYFFVSGFSGLGASEYEKYRSVLDIVTHSLNAFTTHSDVVARYDDGFAVLFSNRSYQEALSKTVEITSAIETKLQKLHYKGMRVVYGVVEDDGQQALEDLMVNAFMENHKGSRL